jgi:uncharacterized protein with HEPN domain
LADIVNSARLITEFTVGLTYEEFKQDIKTQSATLHQFMILGEAVKQLSHSWKSQHPNIPWNEIGRMHDHLIHRYFEVKLPLIWQTIE